MKCLHFRRMRQDIGTTIGYDINFEYYENFSPWNMICTSTEKYSEKWSTVFIQFSVHIQNIHRWVIEGSIKTVDMCRLQRSYGMFYQSDDSCWRHKNRLIFDEYNWYCRVLKMLMQIHDLKRANWHQSHKICLHFK